MALALCASPATAQSGSTNADATTLATAEALFQEGWRLMQAGDHVKACPKLTESYRIDPATGTLLALALCHEEQGLIASAWAEYLAAAGQSRQENRQDRVQAATDRAKALEPRISYLTIELAPELSGLTELEVLRNGVPISAASFGSALPVDPGEHRIDLHAPGKQSVSLNVTISGEGARERVQLPALEDTPAEPSPPPATQTASPAPTETLVRLGDPTHGAEEGDDLLPFDQRTLGFIVGGVGVVGLGVGLVFDFQRRGAVNERDKICPTDQDCTLSEIANINRLTSDAERARTLEYVGFGVGAAALVGGIVLILTAPDSDSAGAEAASRRSSISPFIVGGSSGLASGGGVQFVGAW